MKTCDKIERADLGEMTKGWFIGDFDPSLCRTKDVEVAVKRYCAGDLEDWHEHRVAREYTVIVEGEAEMGGVRYQRDSIVMVPPGVKSNFKAITDVITVVVKMPSVAGDKYSCDE